MRHEPDHRDWLRLEPVDTVAIRDGRPFNAGGDHTFTSIPPRPSTVAGAVHPVVGGLGFSRDLRFAGPLAWDDEVDEALFPWPLDVVRDEEQGISRLSAVSVDKALVDGDDLPPRLLVGTGEPQRNALVTKTALSRYLSGEDVAALKPKHDIWEPELHVGLHKGDGRRAADGMLYAAEHRRLRRGARMLVRVQHEAPLRATEGTVFFGGERRVVEITAIKAVDLPTMPTDFPDGKVLVYLASPAIFESGWRLEIPDACTLMAASIEGPEMVSAWGKFDGIQRFVARSAVAAGSVYYLQFHNEGKAMQWAHRRMANVYGRRVQSCAVPVSDGV